MTTTTHPEAAHGAGERRRPIWPWITLGVLLVLLVVGFFVVESIARGIAREQIGEQTTAALGLPPGTPVEVEVGGGPILFQLATGELTQVDLRIPQATFGELTGELVVHGEGIPLDENAPTELVEVRFALPEEQLRTFERYLSGLPLATISLEDPEIVTTTTFSLFGFSVDVGMGLTPSAEEGELIFTPSTIRVGNQEFSADSLREAPGFGPLATRLLRQRPYCVAEQLPAPLELTSVAVNGDFLVAHLESHDAALSTFATKGTCG